MVCSVRIRACFPLSGSNLSSRCSISGVKGIGSLPMLLRVLEYHDALSNEPKLGPSPSLSLDPLPCSAIGSYLFLSGISTPLAGASGAVLTLLALVPMVSHVVLGGSGAPNEMWVGPGCTCVDGARVPVYSYDVVCAAPCSPLPMGGNFVPFCNGDA